MRKTRLCGNWRRAIIGVGKRTVCSIFDASKTPRSSRMADSIGFLCLDDADDLLVANPNHQHIHSELGGTESNGSESEDGSETHGDEYENSSDGVR